ncbi:PREDICTED: uncharacterized protein LOC104592622 [Nelumbo nucifera]|uniref:Uncharacterized protein LOC104592622 n=1 Tax=Nelumbo nucifera TaxID=4432 RepID=A0A1U7ZCC5_NELNU|nr:PREDICTED: uncharacterized protein LOC104592622 [Nelumbo nucifera]
MHRSASTSRASDEFLINISPAVKCCSTGLKTVHVDDLPRYDPISDTNKKEAGSHPKSSGENAVHLIPLVLILCAIILWLFSHPVVDVMNSRGLIVERVKGLNINRRGNQTGLPSSNKPKNFDQVEQIQDGRRTVRYSVNKSG